MSTPIWQLWVDTGGTFTDCLACSPEGDMRRIKVLSNSSLRGTVVAVTDGRVEVDLPYTVPADFFADMSCRVLGTDRERNVDVQASSASPVVLTLSTLDQGMVPGAAIEFHSGEEAPILAARLATGTPLRETLPAIRMRLATTRGTNALLEEKGAAVVFCVSEGFGDLLRIGDQRRPELFARNPRRPEPLHAAVVEVPGRLAADGSELRPLDPEVLRHRLRAVPEGQRHVAAVALLHSDLNPDHEQKVRDVLREEGFRYVATSAELAARVKILPRAETALVDAYLGPIMEAYLDDVQGKLGEGSQLRVMTSAGGLVPREAFHAKDSLLSGPAGGLIGAARAAQAAGHGRAIIFDMGGTSTDVARFDGDFRPAPTHRVGRAHLLAPALEIESVASGGGSICRYAAGTRSFQVGPESAGAHPGPACYGADGPLTLTDVNLLLGRLDADAMSIPVDLAAARQRLAELAREAGRSDGDGADILAGLVRIADEQMADAVRTISVREGYDPGEFALVAFGGAGGLHACGVAAQLGIGTILYPPDSGLLSARGLREAVPERQKERQVLRTLAEVRDDVPGWLEELTRAAADELRKAEALGRLADGDLVVAMEAELRLGGQDTSIQVDAADPAGLAGAFESRYRTMYSYFPEHREIEVVAFRVRVSPPTQAAGQESFDEAGAETTAPHHELTAPVGGSRVAAYDRGKLEPGGLLAGPAIVQDAFSTLFIAPGWAARVGSGGTLRMELTGGGQPADRTLPEAVETELFRHRFAHLVEEMGELLRRTALSTNVKERLDFSCALLSPDAELVMNAPHIPVHLGALGVCARRVLAMLPLGPGDVAVLNHPAAGGAHLPDVTLLAPVHDEAGQTLLGYVANRAHHAELGGKVPGSMPAGAKSLAEEGVVIPPMKLVDGGNAQWNTMREVLAGGPYPSRQPEENLADLHAQLASVNRGAELLRALAASAGADVIAGQMHRLLEATAAAVTQALQEHLAGGFGPDVTERLDDGTPICLALRPGDAERWVLDFTGTGGGAKTHPGNFNATEAVVRSAVMYGMRLLVGGGFELNEGLMRPLELVLPECLLNPAFDLGDPARCPAVVAGNVEPSQRVVDTLLRVFGLAACSQGTMNNLIFGNERVSYYETVCGGAGATADGPGASALHTHMTNTAITDPEVLERRFPVRLERFGIRPGSGGKGARPGGHGAVRELRFLEPMTVNLLTQHRREVPYGLAGGGAGAPGRQRLLRADGSETILDGCAEVAVEPGDRLVLETPGGGAWGGL